MFYYTTRITQDVRRALDQNTAEGSGVLANETFTLELDELIRGHILPAARNILAVVPLRLLHNGGGVTDTVSNTEQSDEGETNPQMIGIPGYPDNPNFFRLYDAWVQGLSPETGAPVAESWQVHLNDYEDCYGESYARAQSTFSGIAPNPRRPKLFLNNQAGQFEFYGCAYGKAYLRYIAAPAFDFMTPNTPSTEYINFPDNLYDALVFMICALVEASYRNTAGYQLFMDLSSRMLGIPMEALENKDKRK